VAVGIAGRVYAEHMAAIGHPLLEVGTLRGIEDIVATGITEDDGIELCQCVGIGERSAGGIVHHLRTELVPDGGEHRERHIARAVVVTRGGGEMEHALGVHRKGG